MLVQFGISFTITMHPYLFRTTKIFKQGVEKGELREGIDAEVAIDALYSPLFYRLLLKHQPLTKKLVDELVDVVMKGITKS
jgi:ABC-type uncharacterized transport system substrate-binding protein